MRTPLDFDAQARSIWDVPQSELDLLLQPGDFRDWRDLAACASADPDAFFREVDGSYARRVCAFCDVRGECLEYAIAHDEEYGVWGGLSRDGRRRLVKRRRIEAAA